MPHNKPLPMHIGKFGLNEVHDRDLNGALVLQTNLDLAAAGVSYRVVAALRSSGGEMVSPQLGAAGRHHGLFGVSRYDAVTHFLRRRRWRAVPIYRPERRSDKEEKRQ